MSVKDVSLEVREILRNFLWETKKNNERFSLRAMAQKLDLPVSFVSDFLNGKRELSDARAVYIINNLNIEIEKKNVLLNKLNTNRPVQRNQISDNDYHIVEDPNYYSLLCLVELADFVPSISHMSRRLNITETRCKEILSQLINKGYLVISEDGDIKLNTEPLATTEGTPNSKLRLRHEKNLTAAIKANHELDISKKFFNFETLAIDVDDMDKFKKIAIDFLDQVNILSNSSLKKNAVYEFNINFFPRVDVLAQGDQTIISGDHYVQ